jgi:CNT family concentrative nucleoside transporter
MLQFTSLFGIVVILSLAWLCSDNKRKMNWRLIFSGLALQFVLAFLMLKTTWGLAAFQKARDWANLLTKFSDAGAEFVFGTDFREHSWCHR